MSTLVSISANHGYPAQMLAWCAFELTLFLQDAVTLEESDQVARMETEQSSFAGCGPGAPSRPGRSASLQQGFGTGCRFGWKSLRIPKRLAMFRVYTDEGRFRLVSVTAPDIARPEKVFEMGEADGNGATEYPLESGATYPPVGWRSGYSTAFIGDISR